MNYLSELSPYLQALLAALFTTLLGAFGALIVLFGKKTNDMFSVVAESFAAGIMLAASFFSLLNPAFGYPSPTPHYLSVPISFLLGGGATFFFSRFLGGKGEMLYAAVTLHNIPEGLAVGVAFAGGGFVPALLLSFGIGVQNFPEGLCTALPLRSAGMSKKKSFFLALLSGAVEIPSALLGVAAVRAVTGLMPWALSFAAGAMVAVAATELLPESVEKRKSLSLVCLLLGFTIMTFFDTFFG